MRIDIEAPNRKDFDFEEAAKVKLGIKIEDLFSNAETTKPRIMLEWRETLEKLVLTLGSMKTLLFKLL